MSDSNQQKGHDLENYVAALYHSLGYFVETNVQVSGQQVDIVARKYVAGIGETVVAVECKSRKGKSVSNEDVQKFVHAATSLALTNNIHKAVMVSDNEYSMSAKNVARNNTLVDLLTVKELEDILYNVTDAYLNWNQTYLKEDISRSYIPLRASLEGPLTHEVDDVESSIVERLDQGAKFVSILGDYGSGKTTIAERLYSRFIQSYLQDHSQPKPLLARLREFSSHDNLDAFLRFTLSQCFNRDIPLSTFWRALQDGQFILIADGFDEIATQTVQDTRLEYLMQLSPVIGTSSPVILTCRPTFFVSSKEYNEALAALLGNLNPMKATFDRTIRSLTFENHHTTELLRTHLNDKFSGAPSKPHYIAHSCTFRLLSLKPEQVDSFLKNYERQFQSLLATSWQDVKNFLLQVYDLRDLMSRPILLNMIVETVLEGHIDVRSKEIQIGPATLYEIYTDAALDRDWAKGVARHTIARETRRRFAQVLAREMLKTGSLILSTSQFASAISQAMGLGDIILKRDLSVDVVATDIRTCAFMSQRGESDLAFAHKSFMEFFVAQGIKDSIATQQTEASLSIFLPKEILYFLGSYAITDEVFRLRLFEQWESLRTEVAPDKNVARNLFGAICNSSKEHLSRHASRVHVDQLEIKGLEIRRCIWSAMRGERAEFAELQCVDCDWDLALSSSAFLLCRWENCKLTLALVESRLVGCSFIGSSVVVAGARFEVTDCSFLRGNFTVREGLALQNVRIDGAEVILEATRGLDCRFKDVEFLRCTIRSAPGRSGLDHFESCLFRKCLLLGLKMTLAEARRLKFEECRGLILLRDAKTGPSILKDSPAVIVCGVEVLRTDKTLLMDLIKEHITDDGDAKAIRGCI